MKKEAIRVDDIYTNLYEKGTGLPVNFKKVTQWYDGTPMSAPKCDGYLYVRKGDEYFRRVIDKDGELFLEKDTVAQVRSLTSREILLLKVGVYKGVKLNGYYAKGDTPAPIEYYISSTSATDNGGSVIVVGGVKLEHTFKGVVDIRYYGIFSGYVGEPFLSKIPHENLFISKGTYKINKYELISSNNLNLTSDGAIIEATPDFDKTSSILLYLNSATGYVNLEGFEVDGKSQVSECIRILNTQAGEVSKSTIKIRNLKTRNTIKNQTIGVLSSNSCGVYVRGSFVDVLIENSSTEGHVSDGAVSGASRGYLMSQNNNATTWVKKATIRNCSIKNISRINTAEGAPDSDCIFMSNQYSTPYTKEETEKSTLIVENCTMENFTGRAVKSQVGNNIIFNNTVKLKDLDVQIVFDFQRNQGVAYGNKVTFDNTTGVVFGLNKFDETYDGERNIYGNTLEVVNYTDRYPTGFFDTGCASSAAGDYKVNVYNVNVHDNVVKGQVDFFGRLRIQTASFDSLIKVNNNIVDKVRSFFRTWRYGFTTNYGRMNIEFSGNVLNEGFIGENPYWEMWQNSFIYFKTLTNNLGFENSPYTPNTVRVVPADSVATSGYELKAVANARTTIATAGNFFTDVSNAPDVEGSVLLAEGVYNLSQAGSIGLQTPAGVSIIGSGVGRTVVNFTVTNSYGWRIDNTLPSPIIIKGFTMDFQQPMTTGGFAGIFNNTTLEDLELKNCSSHAIRTANSSSNLTLRRVNTLNCERFGLINFNGVFTVEDCKSTGNTNRGLTLYYDSDIKGFFIIQGSEFSGGTVYGLELGGATGRKVSGRVEGCIVGTAGSDIYTSNVVEKLDLINNVYKTTNINAATAVNKVNNQAVASPDTATQAVGAAPTKEEFDALLLEFRDLKNKFRTAGTLATNTP